MDGWVRDKANIENVNCKICLGWYIDVCCVIPSTFIYALNFS